MKGEIYPAKVRALLQTLQTGYWYTTYQVVYALYGNKNGYHTNIKKRLLLLADRGLVEVDTSGQTPSYPTRCAWRITQKGLDLLSGDIRPLQRSLS